MSESTADVIRGVYDAFGRADIPAILGVLDEGIDWSVPDNLPHGGDFHGRDGVGLFFQGIGENWEDLAVDIEAIVSSGERVVVLARIHGRLRPRANRPATRRRTLGRCATTPPPASPSTSTPRSPCRPLTPPRPELTQPWAEGPPLTGGGPKHVCAAVRQQPETPRSSSTPPPTRWAPDVRKTRAFAGLSDAPERIRTSTDQMVHKALNLARLPVPPQARGERV